jgi:hypothetical protein
MNYKTILKNKLLILIDKVFRKFGFYIVLIIDNSKLVDVRIDKLLK